MDETTFTTLLRRAKKLRGDYGVGYQRGIRRLYHGTSFGDQKEHDAMAADPGELGRGYRDGIEGREIEPRPGRPWPADHKPTRIFTVRLPEDLYAKARSLGSSWFEKAIESAPDLEHKKVTR